MGKPGNVSFVRLQWLKYWLVYPQHISHWLQISVAVNLSLSLSVPRSLCFLFNLLNQSSPPAQTWAALRQLLRGARASINELMFHMLPNMYPLLTRESSFHGYRGLGNIPQSDTFGQQWQGDHWSVVSGLFPVHSCDPGLHPIHLTTSEEVIIRL